MEDTSEGPAKPGSEDSGNGLETSISDPMDDAIETSQAF